MSSSTAPIALLVPLVLAAALLTGTAASRADDLPAGARPVEQLLQEALFNEVALNDPAAAIRLYDRVIAAPDATGAEAAIAHLRKGICLHLQGRIEEAEREFQIVVERYAGEAEAARIAARRLNVGTRRHPARFMPPETTIYTEVVDLAEQVGFLSELLRGTPLENPVDYYLATAEGAVSPASDLPRPRDRQLAQLRALLNLGFIKEFQKIEGFALGFSSFEGDGADFVGVFLPGTSDLSRGLIKAILTFAIDEVAENVEGMPVFRLDRAEGQDAESSSRPFYLAMDSGEEAVIFGTSLDLVRGTIRRYRVPGSGPSLADVPDFRRALAARAGSALFTYVRGERLLADVRASLQEDARRRFDAIVALLGLDRLRSTSLTFSRSRDTFRFALRTRFAEESPAWDRLRTAVLDPEVLRLVPAEPLGFLALSLADVESRAGGFLALLEAELPELAGVPGGLRSVLAEDGEDATTTGDGARTKERSEPGPVLGALRSLAVVRPRVQGSSSRLSFYVVAAFSGDLEVEEEFEPFLGRLLGAMFRNRASTEFREGSRPLWILGRETRPRLVEPVPGVIAAYAGVVAPPDGAADGAGERRLVVVAPQIEVLDALFGEHAARPGGFPPVEVPVAACKFLYLRPREIVETFGLFPPPQWRDEFETLLAAVPRVIVHTLESSRGLSIEIAVPEAAPVLREILRSLPTQRGPDEQGARD